MPLSLSMLEIDGRTTISGLVTDRNGSPPRGGDWWPRGAAVIRASATRDWSCGGLRSVMPAAILLQLQRPNIVLVISGLDRDYCDYLRLLSCFPYSFLSNIVEKLL